MGGFIAPRPRVVVDTSATEEALHESEEERKKLERENEARLNNLRSRSSGRSLLAFEQNEAGLSDSLGLENHQTFF